MMIRERKPGGFKVPTLLIGDIRKKANVVRWLICTLTGVSRLRDVDVTIVLERILPEWYGVDVDVIEDCNTTDLDAGVPAGVVENVLYIRDSVYSRMLRKVPRDIFTLFHEFGHIALGHRMIFGRARLADHAWIEDSEWQANCFAGEVLMPVEEIRELGFTEPWELADYFGVSEEAAYVRLKKLSRWGDI